VVDITLLGTGGMYPLPDRALTSLYVRFDGRALLVDCGEGTQIQMRRFGLRFKPIEAIAVTHFHADHTAGLPGLLLTLGNEGRTEPLTMYGPVGLEKTVSSLRAIFPELLCEIQFRD
jgi:ribonuclease Z